MPAFCRDFEDDACPISDRVVAKLYGADAASLPGLLDEIEPQIKPALAFFCYRRAHLYGVGLAIAASCEENELVSFAGTEAGTALFERARKKVVSSRLDTLIPFAEKSHLPPDPCGAHGLRKSLMRVSPKPLFQAAPLLLDLTQIWRRRVSSIRPLFRGERTCRAELRPTFLSRHGHW